ncbi:LamG-like jellyroll fold domain-containing protein [Lacinutrix gracilariae]|uniref:LamG-like jellyroll fold domain-containing protein n=1 Tax=Lacinutrix gracilariae TaxID=1747198 RepID=A0ABW5K2S5_9FLAO
MKTKLLFVAILLVTSLINAQTCNGSAYPSQDAPSSCDYTYTASGWSQNLPNNNTISNKTVCIQSDLNSNAIEKLKGGTLYIAPGVTFTSDDMETLNDAIIIVAGTLNIGGDNISKTTIYVEPTGVLNFIEHDFNMGYEKTLHNAGTINVEKDLKLTKGEIINYSNATFNVLEGDVQLKAEFYNCGVFKVLDGDLKFESGNNNIFENSCATYVSGDFEYKNDFPTSGILIVDGTLKGSNSKDVYNDGTLMLGNLDLGNSSDIYGNGTTSLLILNEDADFSDVDNVTDSMVYVDSSCDDDCLDELEDIEGIELIYNVNIPDSIDEMLADCGVNVMQIPITTQPEATLDFDGDNDYVSSDLDLNGYTQSSIMAWIKLDSNFNNQGYVLSYGDDLYIEVKSNRKLKFAVNDKAINLSDALQTNVWYHVAFIFDSSLDAENLKAYVNGNLVGVKSGDDLEEEIDGDNDDSFYIGRRSEDNDKNFKGSIDEVRVFDIALTESQMQKMIHQEITQISGSVGGVIVPKPISDDATAATISWSNLTAYYPMSNIYNSSTLDYSNNGHTGQLRNSISLQEQTAPIPYVTSSSGDLSNSSSWLHGAVWDMDVLTSSGYAIIKIDHDVTINNSLKTEGLIVSEGKTLTVSGDHQIYNNWYLELNGAIDLQNDSQLIQTNKSDLVTSANGKILRRQEGASSYYWYNYWASPVGQTGVTTLSNNNAAANNTNNTSFSVNMLKKGDGSAIQFISGNHQTDRLSTRWMYTYQNGVTYYDWGSVNQTTAINPGVGYIHKGMGVGTEQQYLFEGKPNNGTIKLSVTDVGGAGSEPGVSKTEYLLGNPYASSIDIHKFLDDNASVLEGSIQVWQQWDGASHVTSEYEGGYAQVNKTGSVRAYQFEGGVGGNNGSLDGTKLPTKYLPVGQGFIAEIKNSGTVVFKNSQRVFVKEADADGTEENGSVFFRSSASNEEDVMQKLRLEFNALDGQATKRELLLGFSGYTTDAYDYGYEAKNTDDNHDDLNLMLDGEYMTIQSYAEITDDKVVPLALKTSGNNSYSIKLTETINIAEDQDVYLRDNLTNVYYNLRQDTAYTFTSTAGVFNDRFEIVFSSQTLSTEEVTVNNNTVIYYNNNSSLLYVRGLNTTVSNLQLINMLGQTVYAKTGVSNTTLENGLPIHTLATGIYIVSIKTEDHQTIEKKIVVK